MRKNRMMRLASALLILTMVTTCAISGTFAKYVTTDSATDTARVAKWGVTVTATGKNGESDAFLTSYDATATTKTVVADENDDGTTDDIIAPGTNGDLGSITIAGTPEVMVDITATAELTLTGWTLTGDWDNDPETADAEKEYCPLVFTVTDGSTTTTYQIGTTYTTIDELTTAIEKAIVDALKKDDVAANTNLADSVSFTWAWPFEGTSGGHQNDVDDTALGDQAAAGSAATITLATSATVTQID